MDLQIISFEIRHSLFDIRYSIRAVPTVLCITGLSAFLQILNTYGVQICDTRICYSVSSIWHLPSHIAHRPSHIRSPASRLLSPVFIQHPASHIPYRESGIRYPASHIINCISQFPHLVSHIANPISHIAYRVSRISHLAFPIKNDFLQKSNRDQIFHDLTSIQYPVSSIQQPVPLKFKPNIIRLN